MTLLHLFSLTQKTKAMWPPINIVVIKEIEKKWWKELIKGFICGLTWRKNPPQEDNLRKKKMTEGGSFLLNLLFFLIYDKLFVP